MKTEGEALGFQHLPWDLANVNKWKIMFDPSSQRGQGQLRLKQYKQANSENLCPPPRFFLRNTESSENVKFIGVFIHTRYILSTYVDSINA